jgi:predicted MarR family transcription regulator
MKGQADKKWHLGETEIEQAFGEFHHAVICFAESFYRFVGKSLAKLADAPNMTGHDGVILNTIASLDRPKSVTEIQHVTNRGDVANVQYSVRKLLRAGLIEKAPRSAGRGTSYRATARGRTVAGDYVEARRRLLAQIPVDEAHLAARLDESRAMLTVLTGLYDQASRMIATRP